MIMAFLYDLQSRWQVIGKGSYGKVMLVRHKAEGEDQVYAMKMLRKASATALEALLRGECDQEKPSGAHQDGEKCPRGLI